MALRGVRACLGYTKAEADRKAVSFKTGILVASCGFKVSAAEMYVREQLTFKVCSMWCSFSERVCACGSVCVSVTAIVSLTQGRMPRAMYRRATSVHPKAVVISVP